MNSLQMESPGALAGATGAGMFSIAAEHFPDTATRPAGQRLPAMLALHIGDGWLAGWAARRAA